MNFISIVLISARIEFYDSTFFLNELSITCRTATVYSTEEKFELDFDDRKIEVLIERNNVDAERISGHIFGRYFEAEGMRLQSGLHAKNLCISLCGLSCPSNGIFGDLRVNGEKIMVENSRAKIFNIQIPLVFVPHELDMYGRSPGFMTPTFSVAQKDRFIIGLDYMFPFPNFDFFFSANYFTKGKFLLGGIYGNDIEGINNFIIRYANPNTFTESHTLIFQGESYHFSSYSDIFTKDYLDNIPSIFQISQNSFGRFFQEGEIKSGLVSFSDSVYIFSDNLTRHTAFSQIFITYGEKSFLSFGGVSYISDPKNRKLSPAGKFFVSLGNFSFSGRAIFPDLGKVIASVQERDKNFFLPYKSYLYTFSEDFLYPFLFSSAYSGDFMIGNIYVQNYLSANIFAERFTDKPKDIGFFPEIGFTTVFPGFSLFLSTGIVQKKRSFIFSDAGLSFNAFGLDFELRNSTYREKFLSRISLSHIYSSSFTLKNSISAGFSNTFAIFSFRKTENKKIFFHSYSSEIAFWKLNLSFVFYFENLKFLGNDFFLSYNIENLCSKIIISGTYDLSESKDSIISFSFKVNL